MDPQNQLWDIDTIKKEVNKIEEKAKNQTVYEGRPYITVMKNTDKELIEFFDYVLRQKNPNLDSTAKGFRKKALRQLFLNIYEKELSAKQQTQTIKPSK